MNGELVVNLVKLRELADTFTEDRRLCNGLSTQLKRCRDLDSPEKAATYNTLITKADKLASVFNKLNHAALDTAADVASVLNKFSSDLSEFDFMIKNTSMLGE